jgi:hypothetical protein
MIRKAFWTMALEISKPAPARLTISALQPITGWRFRYQRRFMESNFSERESRAAQYCQILAEKHLAFNWL